MQNHIAVIFGFDFQWLKEMIKFLSQNSGNFQV